MKNLYLRFALFGLFLCPHSGFSQLNNGGINAFFGIDGDTKSHYVKYGPVTGLINSDDWFSSIASGKNVIDTSNASVYSALLQANGNLGFTKRMSVPLYSKLNGTLWLDAVYGRDYLCTMPLTDSTAFTFACKNGDDPNNWVGGATNFPDKNDLVDVFAHMRRDGITVHDSLWSFFGVSTVGTSGSRYFDIELYKDNFSYNNLNGMFTSNGPDAGHTQWKFDASGNIIQTGDMIVAVNYTPGSAPVVDVRIWVSQATFTSTTPAYFKFGPAFDGSTPAFGYASILSKAGTTAFGAGIANYSATPAQDTTFSTPWGSEISTKIWAPQYQTLQFIEIGLNLTRIGIDPALYSALGLSPCESLFSEIFFKSRSSNSFSSNMQDFVGPLDFLKIPVMDYSLKPDTLRCNRTIGKIQITNNSTAGFYNWKAVGGGNISGSNSDSTQININKPGKYIVTASPAEGCPATRVDTVIVPIDTIRPVASILVTVPPDLSLLFFHGGDTALSNRLTAFGRSKGLLWNWSGPAGFAAFVQNPVNDTIWGTYQLILTEKRNGCKDTAKVNLHYIDFVILANRFITLNGNLNNHTVSLKWQDNGENASDLYEIERSVDGGDYIKIGEVTNSGSHSLSNNSTFRYTDNDPGYGTIRYRIMSVSLNGWKVISNTIQINAGVSGKQYYLSTLSGKGNLVLVCRSDKDSRANVTIYSSNGQLLQIKPVQLYKGENIIELADNRMNNKSALIISLYINNRLVFTQKSVD